MSWNSSKKKRGSSQAAPVIDTRFLRCDICNVPGEGYGEYRVGTLMIRETVRLYQEKGPNLDIGTVIRCPNEAAHKTYFNTTEQKRMRVCEKPPVFKPGPAFKTLGIEHANVYRLLRACCGVPTFSLDELKAGKMRQQNVPESLVEISRPTFGKDYDPNAHIEPRAMPEPIAQEMF